VIGEPHRSRYCDVQSLFEGCGRRLANWIIAENGSAVPIPTGIRPLPAKSPGTMSRFILRYYPRTRCVWCGSDARHIQKLANSQRLDS